MHVELSSRTPKFVGVSGSETPSYIFGRWKLTCRDDPPPRNALEVLANRRDADVVVPTRGQVAQIELNVPLLLDVVDVQCREAF